MRKVFKSFTFWFFIISIVIILVNLIGYDDKNILLIGLNPILSFIIYIANLNGAILINVPNKNIYMLHLLTFVIYGGVIDSIVWIVKNTIKTIKISDMNQDNK